MSPSSGLERLTDAHTIVIPGWRDIHEPPPPALLKALREAGRAGKRLVSICSGAFVLAATGLLDGRRATTHWAYAETFQRRFPAVTLEADVLYVDEGDIITSAGSSAGIDYCLHLIRRDFGAQTANHVARTLVMPPHREGGQAQYVETPVDLRPGKALSAVLDWARSNLDKPLSVTDIARRAAMSERTLLRRFQDATGMTPKAWLTHERMRRAQALLESSDTSLERLPRPVGSSPRRASALHSAARSAPRR